MVNQSVIDSSVDLEQLKDIEDLIPDMDKAISEKVETFLDKSGDQPYAHMNEGYVVVVEVNRALGTLKFSSKAASADVEKLLRSAIANWEQKNERKAEDGELFVTKIYVDGGATLKRMRPAPQGRGYRIRKRSNHVTLFVGAKSNNEDQN